MVAVLFVDICWIAVVKTTVSWNILMAHTGVNLNTNMHRQFLLSAVALQAGWTHASMCICLRTCARSCMGKAVRVTHQRGGVRAWGCFHGNTCRFSDTMGNAHMCTNRQRRHIRRRPELLSAVCGPVCLHAPNPARSTPLIYTDHACRRTHRENTSTHSCQHVTCL